MKYKPILYMITCCFLLLGGCTQNAEDKNETKSDVGNVISEIEENLLPLITTEHGLVSITPTATDEPTSTPTFAPTSTPALLVETPKEAFIYSIIDEEVTIEGLRNTNLTGVFIPSTIDGCPVVMIAEQAFMGCSNLEQVIMSENIREIGDYAFASCTKLIDITLPDSLVSIGIAAFGACGVSKVELPDRVAFIGNQAFQSCTNLEEINLPDSLEEIGEATFQYTGIKQVVIPDKVKRINALTYADCVNLDSVYVGESVQYIDISAFSNCPILCEIVVAEKNEFFTSRNEEGKESNCIIFSKDDYVMFVLGGTQSIIPENVNHIMRGAFYGREGLVKIKIPRNVNTIGKYSSLVTEMNGNTSTEASIGAYSRIVEPGVFQYCANLEEIVVDKENRVYTSRDYTGLECNVIMDMDNGSIVQGCTNSIIPEIAVEIESYAFLGSGIKRIIIPEQIQYIGASAFGSCANLTELAVDKRNTRYFSCDPEGKECNVIIDVDSMSIIQGCPTSIIPEGEYNEILKNFVQKSYVLDDETIDEILEWAEEEPITVWCINEYAFNRSKGLRYIKIPANILRIGNYAFAECNDLVSVIFDEGVEHILEGAFYRCRNLQEVIFSDTVSWIDEYAFQDCDDIESLVLPKRMTELRSLSFLGCDKLKCVTVPDSVTRIDDWAFLHCTSLTTIYTSEDSYAEQWATKNGYEVINVQ